MVVLDRFHQWYNEHSQEVLRDFFTFLRFQSISTDPAYRSEIDKTAKWLQQYLNQIGMEAEIWDTTVHPVVFAQYEGAGDSRPTLLLYQHYDVQPVDPIELWVSPPFEPQLKDNQVYARGASDNKGQCFATITAIKAALALCKKLNVNLKLFVEGEEECGSHGATEVMQRKKHKLQADHLLIVDMNLPAAGVPAITLGLRGIVALEVTCKNSSKDLHSGVMGGIVLNPNRALITMLSQLWDKQGRVVVPGFYDEVEMPADDEILRFTQYYNEAEIRNHFGVKAFQGEADFSMWASNTLRPTLEINGISGGYTGVGFKTVIPAQAVAKISCRLVPRQDPQLIGKKVASFLQSLAPPGIELSISIDHCTYPVRSRFDTPIAQIAAKAYEKVFGIPCQYILCGATVPVYPLKEAAGAETALIGVALDSDDIHAPNEHFGLDRFKQGFLTIAQIILSLGEK